MPQVVQKKLYGSVTVFWLDRVAAVDAVQLIERKFARAGAPGRGGDLFVGSPAGNATAARGAGTFILVGCKEGAFL